MKQTILLIAGYPGTGKTYLANLIRKEIPELQILSPDKFKEKNWDLYGFKDLEEKERLNQKSWDEYFTSMEECFKQKNSIISDYPFSNKQKKIIGALADFYEYQIITIRLTADLDVLFSRQGNRDRDGTRNLGHIVKSYHKEDRQQKHAKADNLLTYDEFIHRCTTRGYNDFHLGKLYEIDVSDFAKVDYIEIINSIRKQMEK
ncbi:AAA family ATPase [Irregularibacter muris]|uniref:AAA family ATPase n=1 Tax=Irregularibacter muris TaxID=1796619 RepID=A0AAE3HIE3_9FIRM|nr:AAA family ATPase [Irregularibacter muris]MCR1900009.1 AAA family ATPase [Irregularibacter muris]